VLNRDQVAWEGTRTYLLDPHTCMKVVRSNLKIVKSETGREVPLYKEERSLTDCTAALAARHFE